MAQRRSGDRRRRCRTEEGPAGGRHPQVRRPCRESPDAGPTDWHATILHLFGLDHKRLTYRFQGRCFRPTDVAGEAARRC
ncbi:MAG TPA: DUF1501 domain-containing protein [Gemmataceae bacterium]|nr:DUF1501 domain-containing protein [Gemmataceae bacterium]